MNRRKEQFPVRVLSPLWTWVATHLRRPVQWNSFLWHCPRQFLQHRASKFAGLLRRAPHAACGIRVQRVWWSAAAALAPIHAANSSHPTWVLRTVTRYVILSSFNLFHVHHLCKVGLRSFPSDEDSSIFWQHQRADYIWRHRRRRRGPSHRYTVSRCVPLRPRFCFGPIRVVVVALTSWMSYSSLTPLCSTPRHRCVTILLQIVHIATEARWNVSFGQPCGVCATNMLECILDLISV